MRLAAAAIAVLLLSLESHGEAQTNGGTGTSPPATCTVGDVFARTGASPADCVCGVVNTWTCITPSAGGGIAFREFYLCPPGNTAAGLCHTFTNLGASFVEVNNSVSRDHLDLEDFTDFRIIAVLSAAAVAGDIAIQCDTDSAFGSTTSLGTLDNPTNALVVGSWTAIPAGECKTAGGQYVRAGMLNGNGTEDPAVRFIRLQVR